ncbi:hypothetical protein UlMin_011723 [Ulmus minor]
MEEDEPLPDNLQCNRTDGRQWRCKRRIKDNLKLCEIHYPQGRHRQYMEKVPESLKLQRKPKSAEEGEGNGDNIRIRATKSGVVAKIMKWKRPGETLKKMKKLKRGETQLELIRMVLQREAEKSKNKKKKFTKDLPNGRMAISSSFLSSQHQLSGNVGSDSPIDVKVGVDLGRLVPQRRFQSKNIEALPIGKMQTLTKCSSCQKLFFCLACIKERLNGELETEAKMKEINLANLHIKQAEDGLNNRPCCNKCKGFILDLHRSCPNCLYNLCLCCRDLYQGNFHGDTKMSLSKCSNKKKTHLTKRNPSSKYIASSASQHDGIACNGIDATSCPSREFGGCGETLLELRCIFPLSWIKELDSPCYSSNVLQTTLNLSWDLVLMFCSYLEGSISRYENNRDLCEPGNCLDWCEVEIGFKWCYIGSLKGRTNTNLFEQQFPAHYDEIIRTLPLQKYTNPASGLLNLVARLPLEIPKPDLGPLVYVSYGYSDQLLQTDSVINLCYDSFDMVSTTIVGMEMDVTDESSFVDLKKNGLYIFISYILLMRSLLECLCKNISKLIST